MENEKKYEFKYIMALFSNIALLNALEYVKINKKDTNAKKEISESNMKDHFLLNKNWNSLINKYKNKFKNEKIIKS